MKIRGKRILVIALIASVTAAAILVERQPGAATWQGKTAAQWFKEFRAAARPTPASALSGPILVWTSASGGRVITSLPGGSGRAVFVYAPEAMLSQPSALGLRALGTNAAIFLETELRRNDFRLAGSYAQLFPKMPAILRRILPRPADPSAEVRRDAAVALAAVGTNAWPAKAAFLNALERATLGDWNYYRLAFSRIGFEEVTWDPILEHLRRKGNEYDALDLIGNTRSQTFTAFRIVTNAFSSMNQQVVSAAFYQASEFAGREEQVVRALVVAFQKRIQFDYAAMALKMMGERAKSALPDMIEGLKDREESVRYEAARILETIGTNAMPAIEALRRATNDSSVMVQRASKRTLEALERTSKPGRESETE